MKKTLPLFKNFYFLTGILFLVWMLVLDSNNLISRFKIDTKLRTLEDSKVYYREKINEVRKDRKELMTDKALLEKFAREKYLMKKTKEDVFIISTEK